MNFESSIKKLIEVNGPIPIDQFMELVVSYYYANNNPFGCDGDFITAPEISQMFGEIIGIWCANHWLESNSRPFTLVEIGGGNGTLMSDLIRGTKHIPNFHKSIIEIAMVETSPALAQKQSKKINFPRIKWHQHISEVEAQDCIVICNEFFDALPIKQFKKDKDGLKEVLVGATEDHLMFTTSRSFNIEEKLKIDSIIETSPASTVYANLIREKIGDHGAGLIIDYGYIEPTYKSTLQAVKKNRYHNILSEIGTADITAHVDFKSLAKIFKQSEILSQGEFLKKYGIEIRAKSLISNGGNINEINSQLDRLISLEHMGELFKAMIVRN